MSERGSESENPVIPSPTPETESAEDQPGLVAQPAQAEGPAPALTPDQPDGRGVQLRRGVQDPRRRRPEAGRLRGDDDLAGLVAGRLRPLRAALHPAELARGRHLPHRGRQGRRRRRLPALRPPQQLARQREPRQGPPTAVAGQAEVRPEDLVGRPAGVRRPVCPGVDGLQDVRLRLRARGHLGARGDLLGVGGHLARGRALQRRPRALRSARRRADGPDLREPGGAQRQARPGRRRPGHPGDLPPDGDERRGDGRAHRRRPHVRQDARCRPGRVHRPRARGRSARGAGPRLEEHLRQRQGQGHDHQRPRGCVDAHADRVGQQLLRDPVRLRVGARREPGRREAVEAEGRRRARTRCPTRTTPRSGTPR